MANRLHWNKDERQTRREELRDALALQFNVYYGSRVDDVDAWKGMCAVLGIEDIPEDLKSCRAVRQVPFIYHTFVANLAICL